MFEYFIFGRLCVKFSTLAFRYYHAASKNPNFVIFSALFLLMAKINYYFYRIEVFLIQLLSLFLSLFGLSIFIVVFWTIYKNL